MVHKKWQEALVKAGINKEPLILPTSDIDDQVVMNVIKSACDVLNLSLEQVADAFGDYWVNVYTQKIYRIYYVGCNTSKDFFAKNGFSSCDGNKEYTERSSSKV